METQCEAEPTPDLTVTQPNGSRLAHPAQDLMPLTLLSDQTRDALHAMQVGGRRQIHGCTDAATLQARPPTC